jgi:hypothetical protein
MMFAEEAEGVRKVHRAAAYKRTNDRNFLTVDSPKSGFLPNSSGF